MRKEYMADRPCNACGYWPNLRRAKWDGSCKVSYDLNLPSDVTLECMLCGNVTVLKSRAPKRD